MRRAVESVRAECRMPPPALPCLPLRCRCETKTKDNVFVDVVVSVQFQVTDSSFVLTLHHVGRYLATAWPYRQYSTGGRHKPPHCSGGSFAIQPASPLAYVSACPCRWSASRYMMPFTRQEHGQVVADCRAAAGLCCAACCIPNESACWCHLTMPHVPAAAHDTRPALPLCSPILKPTADRLAQPDHCVCVRRGESRCTD